MKKIIGLMLLISIILTSVACAEEFSVRGNIDFSTTKEEIMRIEEANGLEGEIAPTGNDFYTENSILYEGIVFANSEDTDVIYYFDEDDKLVSIMYMFDWFEDEETAIEQYNTLNSTLESKYGSSIASDDKYININTDDVANDVVDYETSAWFNESLGDGNEKTVNPMYFEQRLVAIEGGYVDVKITLFNYKFTMVANMGGIKMPFVNEYYPMAISYTYCTEEQVQAVEMAIQEAQDTLDSDL